jgi:hypothetical protein
MNELKKIKMSDYEKNTIRTKLRESKPDELSALCIDHPKISDRDKQEGLTTYFMITKRVWIKEICHQVETYVSFRAEELPGKKAETPDDQIYAIFEYSLDCGKTGRVMHNMYVGKKGLDDFVLNMTRERAKEDQTENDLHIIHMYKDKYSSTPTSPVYCSRHNNEISWDEFRMQYLGADLTEEYKTRENNLSLKGE